MMPYERMGALLSEDASDYVNREKVKMKLAEQAKRVENGEISDVEDDMSEGETALVHEEIEKEEDEEKERKEENGHPSRLSTSSLDCPSLSSRVSSSLPSSSSPSLSIPPYRPRPATDEITQTIKEIDNNNNHNNNNNHCVSSIFSKTAKNPQTDHEVQVNPKDPHQMVHPSISHFHPPFLIIDCRRKDEYIESHIHGAVHVHYVPPKGPANIIPGERLHFKLPTWVEYDTPIITYCAVGLRSGLMVWELRRRGYKFVKVLSVAGYYKWVNEGRPIYAHTGELTQKVLQQHKLAGIMLRKELKAQKRREKQKELQDMRVAVHHEDDKAWPACHHYKQPSPIINEKKKEKKPKDKMAKRRASISESERKHSWAVRHSITLNEPPISENERKERRGSRLRKRHSMSSSEQGIKMENERRKSEYVQRNSLTGGDSSM